MDDGAAGEVERAELVQPAADCPRPSAPAGRRRSVAQSRLKITNALKRLRSAKAPVIRAGVITANIIWKAMKAWCGIVGGVVGIRVLADALQAEPVEAADEAALVGPNASV